MRPMPFFMTFLFLSTLPLGRFSLCKDLGDFMKWLWDVASTQERERERKRERKGYMRTLALGKALEAT